MIIGILPGIAVLGVLLNFLNIVVFASQRSTAAKYLTALSCSDVGESLQKTSFDLQLLSSTNHIPTFLENGSIHMNEHPHIELGLQRGNTGSLQSKLCLISCSLLQGQIWSEAKIVNKTFLFYSCPSNWRRTYGFCRALSLLRRPQFWSLHLPTSSSSDLVTYSLLHALRAKR